MQPSPPKNPSLPHPGRRSAAAREAPDALALWVLGLALVLGLLRFWRLGQWSLWVDEVFTVADGRFGLHSDQLWNPLGYRLVLALADGLAERPDEFALRLLPAIAGWLCIPLAWWAFRRFVGDRRAALVALLLACSSWHMFWSQSARFYTLAMATTLVGGGVFLRGFEARRRGLTLLGLGLTACASAFHVTAALLVPALCLAPCWSALRSKSAQPGERGLRRVLLIALGLGLVGALPWLWAVLEQHTAQKGTDDWLKGLVHLSLTLGYFFTPLVAAGALVGAGVAWRRRDPAGLFVTALAFVVLASALLISTQVLMTAQYVYCLLPWVLLLAVLPLDGFLCGTGARALFLGGGFLLAAPALSSTLLYFTARFGERPRWREAYSYVDEQREPGDLVLGMGSEIGEYYIGCNNPDPRSPRSVSPLGDWHTQGAARWSRHDRRIWVVIRPQTLQALGTMSEALLRDWLARDCRLMRSFPALMEGRDLELRVYLRE